MTRRVLYLACGIPAAVILFLFLTLWFTPKDAIRGLIERVAANGGYTVTFSGFGKAFPLGFSAGSLEIASAKGPLVKATDARVRVKLLPLLAGRVRLSYRAVVGGGGLEGDVSLKDRGWSVQGSKIKLEEVPFFSSVAGARVKGELRLKGDVGAKKGVSAGDLQLEVRSAELAGIKIGEMPLPDASYRTIRGALRIDKGVAELKSFTLDGDGIYVRLKGNVPLMDPVGNSPLNLTLEMMPRPEFLEKQKFVFLLLLKYQTSPGAYSIPIHGTLAHPAM